MRDGLRSSSAVFGTAVEFDSRSTHSQNAVGVNVIEVGVVELVNTELVVEVVGLLTRECVGEAVVDTIDLVDVVEYRRMMLR